jgi:3-deoxy-manno-octulosonate cytidylyltransferase (CMP-KDO synthetase)
MKIFGFIPARMAASRFPGKPLFKILDRTLLEHVYDRSKLFADWHSLEVATCDQVIQDFCKQKSMPCVMTGSHHTRAMDRIAEAVALQSEKISESDIVVMVQGDEPMLDPKMIDAIIAPLKIDKDIECSVLGLHITDEELWRNPDTVKIIHDLKNRVLYTTRAAVPYAKVFTPELEARRIYGIFAFRKSFLKKFTELEPSPLEIKESCDSNRIFDHGLTQVMAPYPSVVSFSVDSPLDAENVARALKNDPIYARLR